MLYSETNDVNTGLLVEVWSKGMLWDRALGYHYIPLPEVSYSNEVTNNESYVRNNVNLETQEETREQQTQRYLQEPQALHPTGTPIDNNSNTPDLQFCETVHFQ